MHFLDIIDRIVRYMGESLCYTADSGIRFEISWVFINLTFLKCKLDNFEARLPIDWGGGDVFHDVNQRE